jgi:hypothetical protein
MLNVIMPIVANKPFMLSEIMLNVVMLSVVMLNVMAPFNVTSLLRWSVELMD